MPSSPLAQNLTSKLVLLCLFFTPEFPFLVSAAQLNVTQTVWSASSWVNQNQTSFANDDISWLVRGFSLVSVV